MSPGARDRNRRLVLVGMMGVGKSSVGRVVAQRLRWTYLDGDDLVSALGGMPVPAIAVGDGVPTLHRLEREALEVALRHEGPLVMSAAASVVDDRVSSELLRDAAVVAWLRARPDTILARVGDGDGRRADARSAAWVATTLAAREARFADLADLVIDVDTRSIDDVAAILVQAMRARA